MMRPGLDKPGALPLLIVVIFSLLTLAPSLSNIYNFKLAELTFSTHGAHIPLALIKEPVAESQSEARPVNHPTAWTTTAQYRTRGNRPSRSMRSGNNLPTIPGELAHVENKSHISYSAADSSFMFSRRARAFRTYFIQQLDDYKFFTPFSNRSFSPETAHINPTTIPPSSPFPRPTSLDEPSSENTLHLNNEPTSSYMTPTNWLGLQLSPLFGVWQQACRATMELLKVGPDSPITTPLESWKWGWSYIETLVLRDPKAPNPTAAISQVQDPQAQTNATSNPAKVPKSAAYSHDETTDSAIRTSPELKGSCMAVVIGLVVGIMWF